jgi:putative ABC transport system permease protein
MDQIVSQALGNPRFAAIVFGMFGLVALALAALGVYGLLAYAVTCRTQEIGVRMALGATSQSVFRLILGSALRLVGIGVFIGVIAAAWLTRFLTTMLFQTERFDVMTFASTAAVLTVVATFASYLPARRGMKVAPVNALRAE